MKKYYVSSAHSYNQIITVGKNAHDLDFSEFAESYTVPLVRTERLELILDGCQYERSMKTEHIADWDIAQKYLNVCVPQAHNCSKCVECLRTLIVIDSMGKLRDFSRVFDIETYRKVLFRHKCDIMLRKNGDGFLTDQYTFARSHGMHFPSYITAYAYIFPFRLLGFTKGCPQNHRPEIL